MASPIKVRVDTDFSGVIQEAAKGADAVEDLAGSFDDAQDASADAARGIDRGMDDAAGSVNKVESATDDLKGGLSGVGGAAQDALAGDFAGAAESAVGSVGDLTSSIPFVGAAVGAVAAAAGPAIQGITDAFDTAREATDAARDSAYEYGLTLAGTSKYADVAGRIDELTGSVEGLKQVQDIANISGWEQVEVVKAMATGDGLPALWKAFEDGANSTSTSVGRVLELEGALEGTKQGFELAAGAAGVQASALYDLAMQAGTATGEVDELGNAIVEMPDGKQVVVDAETGQAYADVDAFEKKKIADKSTTVHVNVDDSAWRGWNPGVKWAQVRTTTVPTGTGTVLKPGQSQNGG